MDTLAKIVIAYKVEVEGEGSLYKLFLISDFNSKSEAWEETQNYANYMIDNVNDHILVTSIKSEL